jgi:hypothetical protein
MSEPTYSICGLPGDLPDGKCDECIRRQEALREQTYHEDDEDEEVEEEEEEMGWEGGSCTRCGMDLDEGYCPNDRCPFSHCYQDEMIEDWKYPGRAEKAYIKKLQGDSKD